MEDLSKSKGFDRYLRPLDGWALALGCMVGWGAFVMPGTTFLPLAGPAGTVIALLLGMCFMLVLVSNFSYLMNHSPRTGGVYSYTKAAFGRDHAFLCSWFLCLSYLTIVFLNGTALFLVVKAIFGADLHVGPSYLVGGNSIYLSEVAVSIAALAGVGLLFIAVKPALQRLHTVLAIVLVAGVVIVAGACLPHALAQPDLVSFGVSGLNPAYAIFSLVILAPWAFVGFEVVSFDTAHFRFPVKRVKPIAVTSVLVAAFIYIAMSLVSVAVLPDGFTSWADYIGAIASLDGLAATPTFYAAESIMGTPGLVIVAVSALAAIFTGIIGGYRATLRVLSSMAEDNILSDKFSRTSFSILFTMAITIAISLLGRNTLSWFVDLTAFGAIVAYGYTSAAAWKIARGKGDRKIEVTGAIGALISIAFALVQLVPRISALEAMGSEAFLLLALWCLLGFVFYWRTIERSPLAEYSGMSTSGTVLFALLVYCSVMWLAKLIAGMSTIEEVQGVLVQGGIVLLVIVFVGLMVMLYVQDLVRRKHEAAEREKIRAVEGNLAKSQFLFNMSHDIRTPMNAIIGYTNLAMQEDSPDALHGYLKKIRASSDHLLDLINDILEMSRIESGKLELEYEPRDLCQMFDETRDLFAEQMQQKGIVFTVRHSRVRNRYVWCDKKSLNRVLLNLVSNAYKFTPEGSEVSVSLGELSGDEDGYGLYEIRVQDTGIGMSKEFVDRMFNVFERERSSTDSGMEGSGLGLAITKSIVDLMGGTIDVITSPGDGTEIIIRMKLRIADAQDVQERLEAIEAGDGAAMDFTGRRLLLVEDNAVNREIAEMILDQHGFLVEVAENGQVALDMVAGSTPGYYDAVLMDIQMPVMDGYAATRAIRSLADPDLADTPILAMTANAFKEDEIAAKEAGMQAHIAKPIDVDVLMRELASVME